MGNPFGNVKNDGLEKSEDRLGGGGTLETNLYTGIVKLAYAGSSNSAGSQAQSLTVQIDVDGFEYRETFWVTGQTGNNWYPDRNDPSKKQPLMGYTSANDLCFVTTGKGLDEQDAEEKVVNLYDFKEKKEVPKNVMVLTELLGQTVTMAVTKIRENKTKKNDSTGKYDPINEERFLNEVTKFIHTESGMTLNEAQSGQEEPLYAQKWADKHAGKTRDKYKEVTGAPAGSSGTGAPPTAGGTSAKQSSGLFGKS